MVVFDLFFRINDLSALFPSAKSSASMTIDFPAPVSPVKILKPSKKFILE